MQKPIALSGRNVKRRNRVANIFALRVDYVRRRSL